MFLVHREAAITRADGPTVTTVYRPDGTLGEHWLDRDHQAVRQDVSREPILVVRHVRRFMNRPTDAMAAQFADDREAIARRLRLDGAPNYRDAP